MKTIPLQQELRPELPNVYGHIDYKTFRDMLIKIDEILTRTDFEDNLITQALERYLDAEGLEGKDFYNTKKASVHYKKLKHALRCTIARHLTGESYRAFSLRLADSTLFQWFTHINSFSSTKAISKSSLERYEKCFGVEEVSEAIRLWLSELTDENKTSAVGLNQAIDYSQALMDSTCVKADIHFPVDWLLLRDAARSLLLAIKTIRKQGLKHRMIDPTQLLKEMNQLCIKMTQTRRKKDSKKQRKVVLRTLKKLTKRIEKHGSRYRALLANSWEKTDWSEAQAHVVISRIDNILEQLPCAIKQAHERIIGGRQIKSADKLLSLYDPDVEVIVRGKAGSEVEFGQRLLLVEQRDGLIIDWELFSKGSPQDSQLVKNSVNRIQKNIGKLQAVSADRAFASSANHQFLKEQDIYNAICPKSPSQLQAQLSDPVFVLLQTRRSQTEARIGIFKNVFLGKPLRSRITTNKRHAINWCVLTHNLWVLSRKAIADEQPLLKKAA